jgi:hypothetical protein
MFVAFYQTKSRHMYKVTVLTTTPSSAIISLERETEHLSRPNFELLSDTVVWKYTKM